MPTLSKPSAKTLAALLAAFLTITLYTYNVSAAPAFGQLADQAFHLQFAKDFHQAWTDHDFPPRWAATANGGRGSVGFTVYPPAFAFLTATFLQFGSQPVDALRQAFFTATLAAFFAIFHLARGFLSTRRSLFAASLTLLLPGVTFVALGRGMFPNFASIAWAALLLGSAQRALLRRHTILNTTLLAVAAAGMILTHALSAYLLALLTLVISPLLLRTLTAKQLAGGGLAALAALLLTCWYWIPSTHASTYTNTIYLTQSHPYLDSTFLSTSSSEGSFRQDWVFLNDLGKCIILAQTLIAFLVVFALRDQEKNLFQKALPWIAGFTFLAATPPVAMILLKLPSFPLTQFAWRWQLLVALWCGVGLASLPLRRQSIPAGIVGALTLLFFSPMLPPSKTKPGDQRKDLPPEITQQEFEALKPLDRAAYAGNLIELRPNQVDTHYYLPAPFGNTTVINGTATIRSMVLKTSLREYQVDAQTAATIRLATYYAPGWTATLDGQTIPIRMDRQNGLQLVDIPQGSHRLALRYQVPWR